MFRSNEAFKVSVDKGPVELINTIKNINTFLTNVPQAREHFGNVEIHWQHCDSIYWYRLTNCSWTLFLTVNCFVSSCYGLFTVSAALLQSVCSFCVRCKQTSILKSVHWLNTGCFPHCQYTYLKLQETGKRLDGKWGCLLFVTCKSCYVWSASVISHLCLLCCEPYLKYTVWNSSFFTPFPAN